MIQSRALLTDLYELDETAWLDAMAELIGRGALDELDYPHLQEYLADMAARDRREVKSRLVVLVTHVLKWVYEPQHRSRSWRGSIVEQQGELADAMGRGVLRNHAESILSEAYRRAVKQAVAETDLPASTFPAECPYTLEQLLSFDPVQGA